MPEQVGDGVEEPLELGVARLEAPQLVRSAPRPCVDVVGARVGVEAEQVDYAGDDRSPDVGFAIGRARRAHEDGVDLQRIDDLGDQAGLAGARLADDRHDPAVAGAHELDGRVEQVRSHVGRRRARRSAPAWSRRARRR